MALAQIGQVTSAFEAIATAVGAGIILGGFVLGTARHLAGWSRRALEAHVLTDGYIGGTFGAALVFLDLILRYGG